MPTYTADPRDGGLRSPGVSDSAAMGDALAGHGTRRQPARERSRSLCPTACTLGAPRPPTAEGRLPFRQADRSFRSCLSLPGGWRHSTAALDPYGTIPSGFGGPVPERIFPNRPERHDVGTKAIASHLVKAPAACFANVPTDRRGTVRLRNDPLGSSRRHRQTTAEAAGRGMRRPRICGEPVYHLQIGITVASLVQPGIPVAGSAPTSVLSGRH